MASFNEIIIMGRLGSDVELKTFASGSDFCNVSVATSESFNDKSGVKQEKTQWHRVTVYGQPAKYLSSYASKGDLVLVRGKLEYRKYEKDGIEMMSADIIAQDVKILSSKKVTDTKSDVSVTAKSNSMYQKAPADDEIPF